MWTRIKSHLAANDIAPEEAIYVCGAAHSASQVAEFGVDSAVSYDIPPRTGTSWLYGLLPSSYAAIEWQFGHPAGSASLAEDRWRKELKRQDLTPWRLDKGGDAKAKGVRRARARAPDAEAAGSRLWSYLRDPPRALEEDAEALLQWCVRIVASARKHGYLSTTANSIAIYQTATLLAGLRNRKRPTPYDFRDAAITCLEKDGAPKKRDIARLVDMMLGGDRIGRIGYQSLPPLARDVYDRLKSLPINLEARTIQRALLDFAAHPEWLPASDLLWKLKYLLQGDVVRPIMGQRELGAPAPRQESWDLAIGRNQGAVIQLGYEGVTVEFVLEQRLRRQAHHDQARTLDALAAVEHAILLLGSERLIEELGAHATTLLVNEPDVRDAAKIYKAIARLVHYYRAFAALPAWCGGFVATGYSHYCGLLPGAFGDRGVKPGDLAAMLQFILTLEGLALSLGCERSQLIIAIRQSAMTTTDPVKLALLWSAECVTQMRDLSSLRDMFDAVLANPIALATLPAYLNQFMLSLSFTPVIAPFTVELMSKAFAFLPDAVLMPWLPSLLMSLRDHANSAGALGVLMKEAAAIFPGDLANLERWTAPWDRRLATAARSNDISSRPKAHATALALLRAHPDSANALAHLIGADPVWGEANPAPEAASEIAAPIANWPGAIQLLEKYPAAAIALAKL